MMSALLIACFYALLPLINTNSYVVYFLESLIPFVSSLNVLNAVGALESPSAVSEWGMNPPGLTWGSLGTPIASFQQQSAATRMQPPAGVQLLILFADCVLYGLFAVWFDQVYQGEFGAAKPWNFCVMPRFMCPAREDADEEAQHAALELDNLVKVFGRHRAVDGMTLSVRRSEIFALLGHNGAGKTTAINCITGMLPMTSGSARVCGVDVSTSLHRARRHLSVCPQDNPLYFEYSVNDHLHFFAALRGVSKEEADRSIVDALTALGLTEKRFARVHTLSGGQKRRLWVATSLLGNTPVVFLDEPTSGMDPANRRKLWDLLVDMKRSGRCILFTTHYLDEADVLAERKAVLDRGRVRAVGTSMQLKRQFGEGYHLRIMYESSAPNDAKSRVGDLVRSRIPEARDEHIQEVERMHAADAQQTSAFILPFDQREHFGVMLKDLEQKASSLGVNNFSVETTSLEEVFLKLGRQSEDVPGTEVREEPNVELDLVSPDERIAVSWRTCVLAVMSLRWRQVTQTRRSLLGTLVIPTALLFYNGWALAKQLRKLPRGTAGEVAQGLSGAGAGLWMTISLAIALPHFATSLVQDKVQRCTYVSTSQGLPLSSYWVGTFSMNYMHFLFLSSMVPLCLIVFNAPFYSSPSITIEYIPAAIVAPLPMLFFAYAVSRCFSSTEASSKFMPAISMFASVIPFMAVYILTLLSVTLQVIGLTKSQPDMSMINQGKNLHAWGCAIHWVMSFLDPFYCLPGTFVGIGLAQLDGLGLDGRIDVSLPTIGGSHVAIPLLGALTLSLAMCASLIFDLERYWSSAMHYFRNVVDQRTEVVDRFAQDADVMNEERRLASVNPATQAVMYRDLVHTYAQGSSREVRAVRGISLGVAHGECFCLLGPNGAGKTTTLDVLTGAIYPPTQGTVSIGGNLVTGTEQSRRAALKLLGNCPQVDPLWQELTGRQHLLFYAKIKGLPPHLWQSQANTILRALGFNDFDADKAALTYSGGMKRKLSLGIALIGSPPILVLDEPSAAVDAAAKRHLWRMVKRRRDTQTVMLTTHSMEEAEALSSRLAIQVKGRLRCLGTPDHIKNTYGSGYQLELAASSIPSPGTNPDAEPVCDAERFVLQLCPSAKKLEQHEGRLLFQLPMLKAVGASAGELSVADLFTKMQDPNETQAIGLQDYSIARPSLEQVFIRFSKEQEDVDAAEQ
eukprot:TRINITY_DN27638_c0_g2_i1.p1 TRINITY_DN27638_c0_g2~~TRINITY_DN27638_c0_g2_i1.p1  ORF type:complete len:1401 (-),score=218.94 TRINITY_DN27638_c0_g2_i1:188-3760(-)